jgi:hypothetical protein
LVLLKSVPAPIPVLPSPVVLLKSAAEPLTVLLKPMVLLKRGFFPFCRGDVGIAAVGRRDNRLRVWQKPNADNSDQVGPRSACLEKRKKVPGEKLSTLISNPDCFRLTSHRVLNAASDRGKIKTQTT